MLIVMTTKHVLVPQRPHNLVQHVDIIVPTVSGIPVVVKHSIELVVHRLRRFLGIVYYDFWADRATNDS